MDDLRPILIGGKYELLRELGSGGSATVYLAREVGAELHPERLVAIKVLRDDGGLVDARMRFSQEIRVMGKLVHPNIVPLFDTGTWGDRLFLVMPFIEGESLATRIARLGRLPVGDVARMAHELCDALAYAHAQRIVHRDVKPSNVLIDASGHVMLSDFGVARWMELTGDDRPTRSGAGVPGTMAYASPEQAAGDPHLDGRSDIFSLGCVLFEALTGELPFHGETAREALRKRLTAAAPPVRSVRPEVPDAVDAAIAKALSATPEDRWQRAADFSGAIALHRDGRPAPGWRRHAVRTGALVLGAALVALGMLKVRRGDDGVAWASASVVPERLSTTTSQAARAFDDAREALGRGRYPEALAGFDRAAQMDPRFSEAALWRTQVAQWHLEGASRAHWRDRAASLPGLRWPRGPDSLHAAALVSLAAERFEAACEAFSRIVRDDSSSFVGWFGLGECRRLDDGVIPDPSSPSGWRFRGTWHEARRAYRRALLLSPRGLPAPLFERALSVSRVRAEVLRPGLDSTRRIRFTGFPRLEGGEVGYSAFPLGELMSGRVLDQSFSEALDRERQYQLDLAELQAARDSTAWRPHEVIAEILELRGQVNAGEGLGQSAERSLARARSRATPDVAVRLSTTETRLLLKAGRLVEARRIADSVARHGVATTTDDARWLAGLATLSGHDTLAARFLAQSLSTEERQRSEYGVAMSPALATAVAELTTAIAFGRCDSVVTNRFKQVAFLVESQFDAARVHATQRLLLADPLTNGVPCYRAAGTRLPIDDLSWVSEPVRSAAIGDSASVARRMEGIRRVRTAGRTAYVTFDAILAEAWAIATSGDSTGAGVHLDLAFAALPAATPGLTRDVWQPAALVRAMLYRALLAESSGHSAAAQRWSASASALWPRPSDSSR
jgi:tetratricopeptide (TPR) repeat protein